MHNLSLISPPDGEPITLDEAKTHLRVELDFEDDDAYIDSLIKASRQEIEAESDNIFKAQQWLLTLTRFPYFPFGCDIDLRRHPVTDVISIEYFDADNERQTLDPALYQVDLTGHFARILPAAGTYWPSVYCDGHDRPNVEIRFTAGHEDTANGIPEFLLHALKMRVAEKYENREDSVVGTQVTAAVNTSTRLVGLHRVPRV